MFRRLDRDPPLCIALGFLALICGGCNTASVFSPSRNSGPPPSPWHLGPAAAYEVTSLGRWDDCIGVETCQSVSQWTCGPGLWPWFIQEGGGKLIVLGGCDTRDPRSFIFEWHAERRVASSTEVETDLGVDGPRTITTSFEIMFSESWDSFYAVRIVTCVPEDAEQGCVRRAEYLGRRVRVP